jgi:hypothetical protein
MDTQELYHLADEIRDMKSNLFVTHDTIEAVLDRSGDTLSVMLAVNTTLELVARHLELNVDSAYAEQERQAHEKGGGLNVDSAYAEQERQAHEKGGGE